MRFLSDFLGALSRLRGTGLGGGQWEPAPCRYTRTAAGKRIVYIWAMPLVMIYLGRIRVLNKQKKKKKKKPRSRNALY